VKGLETIAILNNQSAMHWITKTNIFKTENSTFTVSGRYSSDVFQGIMPDSGAAGVSTAGEPRFRALQKINPTIQLDTSTAGPHQIRFGK
jgi:hypothetical protein